MQHHSRDRIIGIILLITGFICLGIWGYLRAETEPKSPISSNISPIEVQKENIIPPMPSKPSLSIGIVELTVQNLEKMTSFYSQVVGLDLISSGSKTSTLGDNKQAFLRLIEEKKYSFPAKGEAGLYHTAITHNSRKDVANRVARILEKTPERYQGSSDHSATEAFYFSDPEGNGLELYYDRPRSEWKYQDGKPTMGSSYIDVAEYIRKYKDMPVSKGESNIGHIHLKIGNILDGENFYKNILQFEVMNNTNTALFISRDGYHHHLGMNTWESLGAKKRTPNTYGLKSFEIIYYDEYLYNQVIDNLKKNKIPTQKKDKQIMIDDPWGNTIILSKK